MSQDDQPSAMHPWIKPSQFEEILNASIPNYSKIEKFDVRPAMAAGENYASIMLRVRIDVELKDNSKKSISYMMKVPHETGTMNTVLEKFNFFNTENDAYLNVLPKFEALYKAKGLDIQFAPKAYKFTEALKDEPRLANTVLMHDLGVDGFKNINRLEGLNFEQTKYVLRKLAQFGAAGAQCFRVNGPYSEQMMLGMFGPDLNESLAMFRSIIQPMQNAFLANMKNFKDGDKYQAKMTKLFDKFLTILPNIGKYDPDEFNVLIHGDCWLNNILFKQKSNGEFEEMVFVDFQLPRYGHPLADFLNLIITSVNIEHKLKHFDYFLSFYYEELVKHLRILDYDGPMPTLRDFHIKLYKYGIFAIFASFMALPVVLLDPTDSATSDNLLGDGESNDQFKNLAFNSQRYRTYIDQILPWLNNRGLLDTA